MTEIVSLATNVYTASMSTVFRVFIFSLLIFIGPLLAREANEKAFTDKEKSWWAVQPLKHPMPPEATEWSGHPIDAFIAARLTEVNLTPATQADRLERLRRACFDLHGLPPTPEQMEAFMNDERPNAWELLIDHLLASPRYGEAWAQHWLDVVRYAETDGYRADDFRPGAYRYRDYVIRSLNEDKPYHQFVREQIAGDELGDPKALVATAFLRHGIYEWNQRDARMHWDLILHEMTRVTGETFLGLGIGCAQCHDHKFDPIRQKDYFALQAFFSTVAWPDDAAGFFPSEARQAYEAKLEMWEDATRDIQNQIAKLVEQKWKNKREYTINQFPEDIQAMYRKPTNRQTPYEKQMAYLVQRQIDTARSRFKPEAELKKKRKGKEKEDEERLETYHALKKQLDAFDDLKPKAPPPAFIATDIATNPVPVRFTTRQSEEKVDPGFLSVLGHPPPEIQPTETTTGRRRALAEWITTPENPLSTRVIVNRVWQHHFGTGIVPAPNDFGTLGQPPSHPDLLDWLVQQFLAGDWKLKDLHRLIMTSKTYQQTARRKVPERARMVDPANRLLWRFPPRRLSAEQIRDSMLAISGELKHRSGGPSLSGIAPCRSVFVTRRRNSPDEVLAAFDAPSGFDSAPTRIDTTTPTQALMMSNNTWPQARARAFASRLLDGKKQLTPEMIQSAYWRAWSRPASQVEIDSAVAFVSSQRKVIQAEPPPLEDEQGYVKAKESFQAAADFPLGPDALLFRRGSTFEKIGIKNSSWLDDTFTVEAVARLDKVYTSASVNTLVSRWNGAQAGTGGWSFGVTSERSAHEPQNLIVQLVGKDTAGNIRYEVVDSNLIVPMKKPVYLAAAIRTGDQGGTVTFYLRDLSDRKNPLQVAVVSHAMVASIQRPDVRICLGGRDQAKGSHTWDGPLVWVGITSASLRVEQLALHAEVAEHLPVSVNEESAKRVLDLRFDRTHRNPVPEGRWIQPTPPSSTAPLAQALSDFCHALLMSNEAMYLY